jgi:hypothetical protein
MSLLLLAPVLQPAYTPATEIFAEFSDPGHSQSRLLLYDFLSGLPPSYFNNHEKELSQGSGTEHLQ